MNNRSDYPETLEGLHQIIDKFDTLVVDQFGVLHDGTAVYPGVIDCLHIVSDRGIKIAALSNSGRRAQVNIQRLQEFGFAPTLFEAVITSGEIAWMTLRDRDIPFLQQAHSVLLISGTGDATILDDLDYTLTQDATRADFVLITGADQQRYDIQYYQQLLLPAMQAGLPCICANPDVHSLLDGTVTFGPATIAQYYATCGAPVIYFGKPHLPIYRKLIAQLGLDNNNLDGGRVLCVGDSPAHDIEGAQTANLTSALVLTGLQEMSPETKHESAVIPDYVLPGLIW